MNRSSFTGILVVCVFGLVAGGLAQPNVGAMEIVTGSGGSSAPHVKAFDGQSLSETASFFPYGAAINGGVRVASGDINGDGVADMVTGLGPGFGPHVKAFSGIDQSELRSFFSQAPDFNGGIYVAAGDLNDDGFDDIVTGGGTANGGLVRAFSGASGDVLQSFYAFVGTGVEVRVAAGDVNGDGFADIITGTGPGVPPRIRVFDGTNLDPLASFLAYSDAFRGGVYVAAGDVNGDGIAEIIAGAGEGGGTHVKVFAADGASELQSFFAYPSVVSEVRVGAGDVNGDGYDDIITGLGPGSAPHVRAFDGRNLDPLASFFAYNPTFTGGVYVAGVPAIPEPGSLLLSVCGVLVAACGRQKTCRR